MVSKFLEKKVEVIPGGFSQKEGNILELEYYLLESDCTESADNPAQKTYGVEIVKKCQGVLNERKQFTDVYLSKDRTKNLVELLAANTVTPSALQYVLDDLLGQ